MRKEEMVDVMLGKIEQAIVRILYNSQTIDSYHYYRYLHVPDKSKAITLIRKDILWAIG